MRKIIALLILVALSIALIIRIATSDPLSRQQRQQFKAVRDSVDESVNARFREDARRNPTLSRDPADTDDQWAARRSAWMAAADRAGVRYEDRGDSIVAQSWPSTRQAADD
jgi:hypothetical protein